MMKICGIEMLDDHNFVILEEGEFMPGRLKAGTAAENENRNPNFEGTE